MAFWESVAPALIDTAGGILGGLLGKKKKGPGLEAQANYQKKLAYAMPSYIVQGAREAGIHPLVALGASHVGSFASPVAGQSGWGDVVSNAFSSVARGVSDYMQQDAEAEDRARAEAEERSRYEDARFQRILDDQAQIKRDQLNEELVKAQIEEMRSRTLMNAMRAKAVGGAPTVAYDPQKLTDAFGDSYHPSNSSAQEFADQYGDFLGELYGVANWFKDSFNRPGVTVTLPNDPVQGGSTWHGAP